MAVVCDVCRKQFSRAADLPRHRLTHGPSNARPHKCKYTGCQRQFVQLTALKAHINTHTGCKPHRCHFPTCGQSFADPSSCSRHKKEMHEGETHQCPSHGCITRIKRRSSFVRHLAKHKLPTDRHFVNGCRVRLGHPEALLANGLLTMDSSPSMSLPSIAASLYMPSPATSPFSNLVEEDGTSVSDAGEPTLPNALHLDMGYVGSANLEDIAHRSNWNSPSSSLLSASSMSSSLLASPPNQGSPASDFSEFGDAHSLPFVAYPTPLYALAYRYTYDQAQHEQAFVDVSPQNILQGSPSLCLTSNYLYALPASVIAPNDPYGPLAKACGITAVRSVESDQYCINPALLSQRW